MRIEWRMEKKPKKACVLFDKHIINDYYYDSRVFNWMANEAYMCGMLT